MSVLRGIEYVLPLITFPFVVRVLGPETYGKWVYAQVLVGFFALLSSLGVKVYGGREIAASAESAKEIVPCTISLLLILSVVTYTMLASYVLLVERDSTTRLLSLIFGFTLVLQGFFGLDWVFAGFQRFDRLAGLHLVSQFIFVGGVLVLLRNPQAVWLLPTFACLGTFLAGCFGWRWLSQEGVKLRFQYAPEEWWKILKVSVFYGGASFMALVYNKADHLILSWLKGDYALGQYGACYRLVGAIMGFVFIGTSVAGPYITSIVSKVPERFGDVLRKGILLILGISIPLAAGAAVLSKEIVILVLGRDYIESVCVFKCLTLVIPLGALASFLGGSLLFSPGHHRRYAISVSIGAIANMIFNISLIPAYEAIGAAIATVIAQASVAGAAIWMGRRYLVNVAKRCFLHPFLACFVMVLVLRTLDSLEVHVLLIVAIGGAVYLGCLWILDCIDGQELRKVLYSAVGKKSVKFGHA